VGRPRDRTFRRHHRLVRRPRCQRRHLAIDFVVESDRAQLGEIVQRVRDGRLRTNIGNVATLDDAVAALNSTERRKGKTIISVRPLTSFPRMAGAGCDAAGNERLAAGQNTSDTRKAAYRRLQGRIDPICRLFVSDESYRRPSARGNDRICR
jgi:hypothetical protein